MKKTLIYLLALTVVLVLAACAKKEETKNAAAPAAGNASGELKITATNWKFDQAEYKVKKGETLNVKLESKEGAHGIKIDKIGEVGANKSGSFTFDKPGTYDITCNVPCGSGHATMKAKLIVE
ncbi:cytochrome C oxidase subunit II [Paenibacillus mesophilus]|uniref:cupredoxin domain-containing protein n=1 Tax=Paenibacillus mesophilus TaxID=2582849 RepID=UPI00110F118F|nr:cupredoxin domain-containing protein [Paenibacillus mesophilus]TMV44005.1 cytochrome C oxidase subunit II [Paenibacillus mesophilus]